MSILIAGYGYVGKEVHKIFPEAEIYDPLLGIELDLKAKIFDICHVCVPTPAREDGSCDTSAVEDVLTKVKADLYIIRSTIPPGTTDWLEEKYKKNLVFQPEYIASSSPFPAPLGDLRQRNFIILGGRPENTRKARISYEHTYPPTLIVKECSAKTAEVVKYMENSFIAAYVTFCNEFYEICRVFGVDYNQVREGFLLDPRMTPWWTYVYPDNRGWRGHCLPKDIVAIINASRKAGHEPGFLQAVVENNQIHKGLSKNA